MLGLMCLCQLTKLNPEWDRIELEEKMPANVELVQRSIIPIISLFKHDLNRRK